MGWGGFNAALPCFLPINTESACIHIPFRLSDVVSLPKINRNRQMNSVMMDLWPYLLPVLLTGIVGLVGWVHNLRTRVAILEKTVESQQKRIDSHSIKQDGLLDKMNSLEKKMIEQVGGVRTDIQGLLSEVKGLSNLILISDPGVKVQRQQ